MKGKLHPAWKQKEGIKRLQLRRDNSYKAIARDLGVPVNTLRNWHRQTRAPK